MVCKLRFKENVHMRIMCTVVNRLQLSLNAAGKGVHDVWQFFSTLTMIVNFFDSSAKRHSMLKARREEEILDLVAAGTLETGSAKNQTTTLQRAGATRWGSHLHSISSLLKLFKATQSTIDDLYLNGADKVQGEAKAVAKLEDLRDKGWDNLIEKVTTFCCEHDISMPDMTAPYRKDFQLSELDSRFTENSKEILTLGASFDPHHNFRAFKREANLQRNVQKDSRFKNTTSVSHLCHRMFEFDKNWLYPMIYRLICLTLTLPVSTATTERAFSCMNIVKSILRNKMNDEFLDDLMVLYIERTFADSINNDDVVSEFELSGSRRVKFS
ncbi:uncharacterized protein LOC141617134 [Silene latifolia]|uniref:uncharacterized protein LOC141617134 n=1 Tax=Silene latifolia TaxID=37657 RepID=UPI003D7720A6